MKTRILVIDVESVGIQGPGFAVGWVLMDLDGTTQGEGLLAARPDSSGVEDREGLTWVKANVAILEADYRCHRFDEVRSGFWEIWNALKANTILAADVAWPVEANFLAACIHDNLGSRRWDGPYPLLDIASFRLGAGEAAMATESRLPSELPIHHPLCDARQSARQLKKALAGSPGLVNRLREL